MMSTFMTGINIITEVFGLLALPKPVFLLQHEHIESVYRKMCAFCMIVKGASKVLACISGSMEIACKWLFKWYKVSPGMPITLIKLFGVASVQCQYSRISIS